MARRTAWADALVANNVGSGSQLGIDIGGGMSAIDKEGRTITRLIGELGLYSTTVAGLWGVQALDLGIAVIDGDAATALVFPDPNSASDEPPRGWLFRTRCIVAQNGSGAPVVYKCMFDLHAQRKLYGGGILMLIANNTSLLGTSFIIQIGGIIRSLNLLP